MPYSIMPNRLYHLNLLAYISSLTVLSHSTWTFCRRIHAIMLSSFKRTWILFVVIIYGCREKKKHTEILQEAFLEICLIPNAKHNQNSSANPSCRPFSRNATSNGYASTDRSGVSRLYTRWYGGKNDGSSKFTNRQDGLAPALYRRVSF